MKTCEEYVLKELEALKKENASLKEQVEELTHELENPTNYYYKDKADYYNKIIQRIVELTLFRKVNVGGEATILHFSNNFISNKFDKEDYALLEPFTRD